MGQDVDSKLIHKLDEIAGHYQGLMNQLADSAVASDPVKSLEVAREMGRLKRLVEPFEQFRKVRRQLAEVRALSGDTAQDAELR